MKNTHIGTILDVLEKDIQIGLLDEFFDRESVRIAFESMREHLKEVKIIKNDLFRENM